MQYLSLALYAAGLTDYRFLSPLLQRLCEDICLRDALDLVEVSEVLALDDSDETRKESRGHRILDAARRAGGRGVFCLFMPMVKVSRTGTDSVMSRRHLTCSERT